MKSILSVIIGFCAMVGAMKIVIYFFNLPAPAVDFYLAMLAGIAVAEMAGKARGK